MAIDGKGVLERVEDALRCFEGIAAVLDVVEYERKLITGGAGQGIGLAIAHSEALGDFGKDKIAGVVAKVVVDEFEGIEVDVQEGDEGKIALGLGDALREAVGKEAAVRQAGEVVDQGHPLQSGFGFFTDVFPSLNLADHGVDGDAEWSDFGIVLHNDVAAEVSLLGKGLNFRRELAEGMTGFRGLLQLA